MLLPFKGILKTFMVGIALFFKKKSTTFMDWSTWGAEQLYFTKATAG